MQAGARFGRVFVVILIGVFVLAPCLASRARADERSHYRVARECAELSFLTGEYFSVVDKEMAEVVKKGMEERPEMRPHEETITKLYQEGVKEFLVKTGAFEKMWDQTARGLMSEFSEDELRSVKKYLGHKVGDEFLSTQTGTRWKQERDEIIEAWEDHVRESLDSHYDLFRQIIRDKLTSYREQGRLPENL